MAVETNIGEPYRDGEYTGRDKGVRPAAVINQKPRDQRRTGDTKIAKHAIHRQRNTRLLAPLHHHRQPHRMIDRRERTNAKQPCGDLE